MALTVSPFPALQRFSPGLLRTRLICSRHYQKVLVPSRPYQNPVCKTRSRTFSTNPVYASVGNPDGVAEGLRGSSPLSLLSKKLSESPLRKTDGKPKVKNGFFPEVSDRVVAYWLLGSAASVFGIIVFGGLTRLTESGSVS